MPERTIHIAQRCTTEEAAAIMAAVRAYEERLAPSTKPGAAARWKTIPDGSSGHTVFHASPAGTSASASGIVWKHGEASLGRGI